MAHFLLLVFHAASADESILSTSLGAIRGVVRPGSRQWLRVPYAEPPAKDGSSRWRPPTPKQSWDGVLDGIKVVSVNFVGFPSVGFVSLDDVFGLGVFGHLVKGDFVGIVQDNEVVKLLVGGEGGGCGGDTLLEATISGKSVDVVVEDLVVIGVVGGGGHLFGGGHTNGVGDSLSKRTGGALNSGGVVFRGREFRVTRGHGVVLTEVLDFFHRKVKSGKVQPGVKEHGSVSGRKDESVTVDPGRVSSVVLHLGSVKGSSNFGGSKRKTHVSGVGGGNGVHGKTTGFIGSGGKSSLGVRIDSSALQESWLRKSKYPKKKR